MKRTVRVVIGLLCLTGLAVVFLFQQIDAASLLGDGMKSVHRFIINRTVRFLLNDLFAIGLIYAIFNERKYVVFAVWVQLAGLVAFLFPYFILKLNFPRYNGPLISFLHRMIVNPLLLLLLIPAFYYQRWKSSE